MECKIRVALGGQLGELNELGLDLQEPIIENMKEQLQKEAKQHYCVEHCCGPVFISVTEVFDESFCVLFDVCCDSLGNSFTASTCGKEESEEEKNEDDD